MDLVCKYDRTSLEFCFNDLSDLFIDLVGFKNDDRYKRRENRKKKLIPNSPNVKLGIDCSICFEDVGDKGVYNLACGHLYHSRCLKPWLVKKDTCPMCRQKINILR